MSNESKLHKPEDLLSGVPVIGGDVHDQKLIRQGLTEFVKVLDPILNNLGQAIAEVQGRLTQLEDLVNGVLVDILAERVSKKLNLKNPHFESLTIGDKEEKKKTTEEKAWDGEGIKPPEGQVKEVKNE